MTPLLRLVFYGLVAGVGLHGIVLLIVASEGAAFAEDGLLEWLHCGLMLAASGLFLWARRSSGAYPSALVLCSMLSLVAASRELDRFSELLLFEDAHKFPIMLIVLLAAHLFIKHGRALIAEIAVFTQATAFPLLAFGLFMTTVAAQILGQAEPWQALVEGSQARAVKRVIEESLETLGYVLLFFGAVESWVIAQKDRRRQQSRAAGLDPAHGVS